MAVNANRTLFIYSNIQKRATHLQPTQMEQGQARWDKSGGHPRNIREWDRVLEKVGGKVTPGWGGAPASGEGNNTPIIQSQLRERAKETRVTEGISER